MRKNQQTVIHKLHIVDEAYREPRNISPITRNLGVQPSQLRKWNRNYVALDAVSERLLSKLTVRTGFVVQHAELESQLYRWVDQLCNRL